MQGVRFHPNPKGIELSRSYFIDPIGVFHLTESPKAYVQTHCSPFALSCCPVVLFFSNGYILP